MHIEFQNIWISLRLSLQFRRLEHFWRLENFVILVCFGCHWPVTITSRWDRGWEEDEPLRSGDQTRLSKKRVDSPLWVRKKLLAVGEEFKYIGKIENRRVRSHPRGAQNAVVTPTCHLTWFSHLVRMPPRHRPGCFQHLNKWLEDIYQINYVNISLVTEDFSNPDFSH